MRTTGISMVIALLFIVHAGAQTNESASSNSNGLILTPAIITAYTKDTLTIQATNEAVPFYYQSSLVNQAIIAAYTNNPTVWSNQDLFIVGFCLAKEHRYAEAKSVFSRLTNEIPGKIGAERAYANASFLKGDFNDARNVYRSLWTNNQDVASLKGLGSVAVQEKDIDALRNLVPALIEHKADDLDFRKLLLLYSLMEEDTEKGGPVYAAVVRGLKKSEVEENADFRRILITATMKYKLAAEQTNSPYSSPGAGSKR